MAELAKDAVLVSSTTANVLGDTRQVVRGPTQADMRSVESVLNRYATVGFQASNLARAFAICEMMLTPQAPSPPLVAPESAEGGEEAAGPQPMVMPTIFVGVTANLFGTGCREAIRFLCKECVPLPAGVEAAAPFEDVGSVLCGVASHLQPSPCASKALIHVLVVSGGAMEHDIRRACAPYRLSPHANVEERVELPHRARPASDRSEATECHFGNVCYEGNEVTAATLFPFVMGHLVDRLVGVQQKEKSEREATPVPEPYYDVCSWAIAPSTLWHMAGLWLSDIFAEGLLQLGVVNDEEAAKLEGLKRAESTVLYWAARNNVPIFSPSLTDGDIMEFITAAGDTSGQLLQLDLVADINRLNKLAMRSRRTGMIVLGGGVVKHHVCNANLMRNGADYAVFLNNAEEFDGSDAGARPGEAISWGKLRLDSAAVKVHSEVTLVFPLLVVHVFVAWVKRARGL